MSIKETDIQEVVTRGAGTREWFLQAAKEMSEKVANRLKKSPEDILLDLEKVKEQYTARIKEDENPIRAFSPLRATALYLDILCTDPLLAASKRYERIQEDLVRFAGGMTHISAALLQAEGGIMRGIRGQAEYELGAESIFRPPEEREHYIELHRAVLEATVRRQVANLMENRDGTVLLQQEYDNMVSLREGGSVFTREINTGFGWSAPELSGAEFAIEVFGIVLPHAKRKFQGVILK